jgi:hypothetical protein
VSCVPDNIEEVSVVVTIGVDPDVVEVVEVASSVVDNVERVSDAVEIIGVDPDVGKGDDVVSVVADGIETVSDVVVSFVVVPDVEVDCVEVVSTAVTGSVELGI